MISIPTELQRTYTTFIKQIGVQTCQHRFYLKWLRYYLDFCHKYNVQQLVPTSLKAFKGKLKEKKQAENLRKQADHAISLFYEMEKLAGRSNQNDLACGDKVADGDLPPEASSLHIQEILTNQVISPDLNVHEIAKQPPNIKNILCSNVSVKQNGVDWTEVYNELNNSIKMRHYSPKTLKTYTGWVHKLQTYTKSKDPQLVSVNDVKSFLTWLAVEKGVAASSQNQAFNALLFLFRNVFKQEFGKVDGIVRAKRKTYIPIVLSKDEVAKVIEGMKYPHKLIISLMYGCGLRISECLSLRVHNFNFDMKILTIHDGKGKKDRTVPIPELLMAELKAHLEQVIALHEQDIQAGYNGVFLYGLLEKKYKNAAKELVWQWFFPARELT